MIRFSSLALFLALSGACPLGASLLYSNLAPTSPSFDGSNGFTTEDNFGWTVSFVPVSTGTVSSVDLPLDNAGGSAIDAIVSIYGDNGAGAPGTLLETLDPTPTIPNTPTLETANASTPVTLTTGSTYWLVVFTSGSELGVDDANWFQDNTSISSSVGETEGNNSSFIVIGGTSSRTDPAFDVNGTTTAPEPATFAIAGLGLLGLALVRMRTPRRPAAR